ncbi:AAA family ATPase [Dyella sp. ASV21]|uniref:ATP-dependent DNA helicase n=1 Tax=Dyella sp. ASV21 TaxID=2795114 RepID=UPI0018EC801D|nr:AAA family ATPase [Dyella sp. ASV21]
MLTLNADQQAAAAAFTAFMVSPEPELVISGPAGVGKTTLLKHLMSLKDPALMCSLLGKKPITEWALTATTNKAAEVLQEATGITASTIHSYLGLRVVNDFESGQSKITRKGNSDVVENTLIVVDECSMVDTQLRKYIEQCTLNCKIIYVGDHCQMAPVMETMSPVFADNDPVYLNTVVRSQHTPEITALCSQLRETVETGVFRPMVGNDTSIQFLDPAAAEQEIRKTFLHDMKADARILCYTNAKVLAMNGYLRQARNLPERWTKGEWAVSNSMSYGMGSKSNRPMLRVEQDVEILDVSHSEPWAVHVRGKDYFLPIYLVHTPVGIFRVPVDVNEYRGMVKELARLKEWVPHFNLKEYIADLRPRDACTVYKAQGSTYHTAFVDLGDIGTCTNPAQAARMLYVACSRATHRICFIGQLPARYR